MEPPLPCFDAHLQIDTLYCAHSCESLGDYFFLGGAHSITNPIRSDARTGDGYLHTYLGA